MQPKSYRHVAMSLFFGAAMLIMANTAGAQKAYDNPNGDTHVVCLHDASQSYELYIPPTAPAANRPILYTFDPGGNGKSVLLSLAAAAEANGWVIAASNNAKNGPWADIFAAQDAIVLDTEARFNLHPTRRFAAGFSGGARASLALAFRYPDKICGVLCLGAGWPVNTDLVPSDSRLIVRIVIGTSDSNYTYDIPHTQGELTAYGVRCVMDTFNGGHEFPPAPMVATAAQWLNANAEVDVNEGIVAETCSGLSLLSQPPSGPNEFWGSFISDDRYDNIVYDDFHGVAGPITRLRWWGITAEYTYPWYWFPREQGSDDFAISFHTDAGGLPGAAVHVEITTAVRTNRPAMYNNNYQLRQYEAVLSTPVHLASGWLSIKNLSAPGAVVLWLRSPDGNGHAWSYGSGQYWPESGDAAVCVLTDALTVAFSATPTWGEPPHHVTFHATVADDLDEPVEWLWDFGDGATSTDGPDTDHEYTVAGVYSVSVTASTPTRNATETQYNLIVASHSLPATGFGALAALLLALAYTAWRYRARIAGMES